MNQYNPTEKEIIEVKQEYSKKKYIGTDKFIELDTQTAIRIVRSRQIFNKYINSVHKSHCMVKWTSKIMAPAGTPRFYSYRYCTKCGGEQYYHAAGRFIDRELKTECR